MRDENRSDAFLAVAHIYRNSPGQSWRRLNGALHGALEAAIIAHLKFDEDDFDSISHHFRGGYWMGNSDGGVCGERYYNLAVKCGHTPACISFEKYAGRTAVLWAEKVKTPSRLHIGERFTWEGLLVTVTSMKQDHLIACSYKEDPDAPVWDGELKAGQVRSIGHSEYRRIDDLVPAGDGSLIMRLGPAFDREYERDAPDRRFKITYAELTAKRKEYDQRRKAALKEIDGAESPEALLAITERLNAAGRHAYRHFDIEEMTAALRAKRESFDKKEVERVQRMSDEAALAAWRAGAVRDRYHETVALRVNGAYVETSTGHSVRVESAKTLLPWALSRRKKYGAVKNINLDLHPVERVSAQGILIGCTLVPWPEIEALPGLLAATEGQA
jgi:hypothetical protein